MTTKKRIAKQTQGTNPLAERLELKQRLWLLDEDLGLSKRNIALELDLVDNVLRCVLHGALEVWPGLLAQQLRQ